MASSSLIDVRRVVVLRRVDVRCGSEGEGPDSAGLVGVDMLLAVLAGSLPIYIHRSSAVDVR